MRCPMTMALPSEGVSSEPMMLSSVVLPEPLGPTRPANSPLSNDSVTPSRAVILCRPMG